jgi:hypothetical protein
MAARNSPMFYDSPLGFRASLGLLHGSIYSVAIRLVVSIAAWSSGTSVFWTRFLAIKKLARTPIISAISKSDSLSLGVVDFAFDVLVRRAWNRFGLSDADAAILVSVSWIAASFAPLLPQAFAAERIPRQWLGRFGSFLAFQECPGTVAPLSR